MLNDPVPFSGLLLKGATIEENTVSDNLGVTCNAWKAEMFHVVSRILRGKEWERGEKMWPFVLMLSKFLHATAPVVSTSSGMGIGLHLTPHVLALFGKDGKGEVEFAYTEKYRMAMKRLGMKLPCDIDTPPYVGRLFEKGMRRHELEKTLLAQEVCILAYIYIRKGGRNGERLYEPEPNIIPSAKDAMAMIDDEVECFSGGIELSFDAPWNPVHSAPEGTGCGAIMDLIVKETGREEEILGSL